MQVPSQVDLAALHAGMHWQRFRTAYASAEQGLALARAASTGSASSIGGLLTDGAPNAPPSRSMADARCRQGLGPTACCKSLLELLHAAVATGSCRVRAALQQPVMMQAPLSQPWLRARTAERPAAPCTNKVASPDVDDVAGSEEAGAVSWLLSEFSLEARLYAAEQVSNGARMLHL
jgi:hypothetical protein